MYKEQVEVPLSLRPLVLKSLYTAKQGVLGKAAHATIVLIWISNDIRSMRKCSFGLRISLALNLRCIRIAEITVKPAMLPTWIRQGL